MPDAQSLDEVIARYHTALAAFMQGDSSAAEALWSHGDDATLGNPFGPFARGFDRIAEAMRRAAAHYRDGAAIGFDSIAKCVTPALAYIVEVERLESKVGGAPDASPVTLRVTSIFRPEDGSWKLLHRHADPITTTQPARSVVGTP